MESFATLERVHLHWTEGDFHKSFPHDCENVTLSLADFMSVLRAARNCQDRADALYPEYVGTYTKVKATLEWPGGVMAEWRFDVNSKLDLASEFTAAHLHGLQAKVREIEAELAANGAG